MPQASRYYRETAVKIMAVMRHLDHCMYGERVTKVMNPGPVMIADIRNTTFGQKFTERPIDRLWITIGAIAFYKEETVW